ncbi:MAG: lycopene cyclase domain-containing protein [Chloroflexota bacterium]|nr:lycopene cyclase domain-containing protein [Chloroflexota bacterium]
MFGNYTYLLWLFTCIGLPLLALLRWRLQLWQQRRALAWVLLGSLVGGWAWDALAVRFELWYYDPANIVGVWLLGLPLEEWLWIAGTTLLFGGLTVILAQRAQNQPHL